MPKVKTHSGAKKRFKRTATGKFKFRRVFKRHLLTNRSLNPRVGRSLRDLRVVRAQVADAAVTGAYTSCQSQHSTC